MFRKIPAILGAALFCAGLFAQNVADMSLKVPESWKPKVIMDRDFWMIGLGVYFNGSKMNPDKINPVSSQGVYYPLEKTTKGMRELSMNPAFYDTANIYHCRPEYAKKNPDGTYSFLLPPVAKNNPLIASRPFFLYGGGVVRTELMRMPPNKNTAGMSSGEIAAMHNTKYDEPAKQQYHRLFFGKFDNKNLAKFREEYPNCIGITGCFEWFNDGSSWLFGQKFSGAQMLGAINEKEAETIRTEWFVADTSFDARLKRTKKLFDRGAEIVGGAKNIFIFDGSTCVGHLAAYYGAGIIGCETSRTWRYWENQMICERGAARQFGIPWAWYIASWGNGYTVDGKYTAEPYHEQNHPLSGSSHSLIDRVFYYAYLSGANFIEREAMTSWFTSFTDWGLGPQGQSYVKFYHFTKANPDRGTPYTPIALLRPAMTPSSREGFLLRETDGSGMDNAFRAAIYRMFPDDYMKSKVPGFQYERMDSYRPNKHDGVRKAGFEMSLANTAPYGDVFDALTPDFPDQTSFKRIIPAYKVAILLGEYAKNPEMAKVLMDYVRNGGTLVINTRQLNADYPKNFTGLELAGNTVRSDDYLLDEVKLAGAQVIRKDSAGFPLFTRNSYGKGIVIVTTPQYMIPPASNRQAQANDANAGKLKFPHIETLLKMLCAEVNPVKVEGDVKFGLNKTDKGWWLYLFNNKGVMKLDGKPQWFDMNRVAEVKIDFDKIKVNSVKELRSGEKFAVKENKLTLKINPGDFKILELK